MAWGSRAALVFAARHPERVRLAALFDLSIDIANPAAQKIGARQARAHQVAAGDALPPRPIGWHQHLSNEQSRRAIQTATAFDLPAAASQVQAKTLIATGDLDPNLVSSRRAARLIPTASLEILCHTGHGSVLQKPNLTAHVFKAFQAKIQRTSQSA